MSQENDQNRSAVSPVVAVVLMVAVTVILAAVIGSVAFDMAGDNLHANKPEVGLQTTVVDTVYTAKVVTGNAQEIRFLVNGTEQANIAPADPGDKVTINASPGATITAVEIRPGSETVILSQTRIPRSN